MAKNLAQEFFQLTPETVLAGVEAAGFTTTGRYFQLNSYENRVFDIALEPGGEREQLIAKYYRPGRWSEKTILEEHFFLEELTAAGIPAVAPLKQSNNSTLSVYNGLFLALFAKARGRMLQELGLEQLKQIGTLLARLHNVGEQRQAKFRPVLTAETYGADSLNILADWVAPEVWERYEKAALQIIDFLSEELNPETYIRVHGDCHRGNILQQDLRDEERKYFFVDFDDFCMGPVAQDFWMLLSGEEEREAELEALLSGYEELRHFPKTQLNLLRPLQGLRIIYYAAWIAKRWSDPSFPKLFPDYESYTYWAEETEALERIAWGL